MPNTSTTQDQLKRNGHDLSNQDLFEQPLDTNTNTLPPTQSKLSESVGDDWSSLTKELINTLPRVWTRGLLYLLVIFAGIVLPWATLSKVDETGSARGRLAPKGATLRLDAPAGGTVADVKVKEGQAVKAGQILLELESDLIHTDLQQARTKQEEQLSRLAQLEAIKNQLVIAIGTQQQQNQAQKLEKSAQVDQARDNLSASRTAYTLQAEKLAQVGQARENLRATQTAYALARSRFAKDQVEVQRYRQLWQQGVVPQIKVIEVERTAEESRRLRAAAQADVQQATLRLKEQQGSYQKIIYQAQAEIQQAKSRLQEQQSGYQSLGPAGQLAVLKSEEQLKNLETQITALQAEISQSKSQIQSLEFQLGQRVLRAPVNGVIFQLPVSKAKAVVQPGQMIAQIAPQGVPMVLRAQMTSQESGFLRLGMPVKLKFDAYPFQDYGVVPGHLKWISPDSKVVETAQGQIETFELEIVLDQPYIQTQDKRIALTPGQTATAEVIVRQRRIIDFILDPFKKLQKGGLEL